MNSCKYFFTMVCLLLGYWPCVALSLRTSCPSLQLLAENLTQFSDRKLTDKFDSMHVYQFAYAHLFKCLRNSEVAFLEIGVGCGCGGVPYGPGGSPHVWKTVFPRVQLHMMEIEKDCGRITQPLINGQMFIGDQSNPATLNEVKNALSSGVDILIDDGGHHCSQQITTLQQLFPSLIRPGGVYVIEDMHSSFMGMYGGNPTGKGSTAVNFITNLFTPLVGLDTLPRELEKVSEVSCVNFLCWLYKDAPADTAPYSTAGDCPKYRPVSPSRAKSSFANTDLPPSLIQYLRCLPRRSKVTVVHVTDASPGAEASPLFWGHYHSYGSIHKVAVSPDTPLDDVLLSVARKGSGRPISVVVDDGTLPTKLRRQVFNHFLRGPLEEGGFYVFQVPPTMPAELRAGLKELMEELVYGFYFESLGGEAQQRYPNQYIFYAGCGASNVCFVQKRHSWISGASTAKYFSHVCRTGNFCNNLQAPGMPIFLAHTGGFP